MIKLRENTRPDLIISSKFKMFIKMKCDCLQIGNFIDGCNCGDLNKTAENIFVTAKENSLIVSRWEILKTEDILWMLVNGVFVPGETEEEAIYWNFLFCFSFFFLFNGIEVPFEMELPEIHI